MSLRARVNGVDYVNWKSADVLRNIEQASGAFVFRSSADKFNQLPVKRGESIEITVDGIRVLTGFIERIAPDYSEDSHDIVIAGRDRTCDFIDSTVGDIKEFDGAIGLDKIARTVLDGINLQSIGVLIAGGITIEPFKEYEITSAKVGEKCFEFVERHARKRQVLLNTDGLGNLLLTRASNEILPIVLRNKKGAQGNNMKSGQPIYDDSNRFYKYKARGELNLVNLDDSVTPEEATSQQGEAIDPEIRQSRVFEFDMEESADSQSALDRAKWEANIRRARSLTYMVTVQGFSLADGIIWAPNKLVEVDDDFANIRSKMLIKQVRYQQSLESGSATILDMTYSNAYTLEMEGRARDTVGEGLV